jgi:quercetin dioxygenase-like cupin family protein
MPATVNSVEQSRPLFVLGETIRPLMTTAMGSSIEICDMRGPAEAGPPPHRHPWEEIYVVIEGELEITVDGVSKVVQAGGVAHVSADTVHSLRNVTEAHFLTVTTKGRATRFFTRVFDEVEMSPPDLAGIVRVAAENDIQFEL